jgi:protoporphyrinogen IX oxidase
MYEWIKAIHIIAVMSWMAGLLYLPRLFVYHTAAEVGSVQSETFKVMERRLLKAIMTPAMLLSWGLGLWLASLSHAWTMPWFQAKAVLVIIMSGLHGYLGVCVKRFTKDTNTKSSRFFRFLNEAPTLLMVAIVILVVVKPF